MYRLWGRVSEGLEGLRDRVTGYWSHFQQGRHVFTPALTPEYMAPDRSSREHKLAALSKRMDAAFDGLEDSLLRLQDIHRRMDELQGGRVQ